MTSYPWSKIPILSNGFSDLSSSIFLNTVTKNTYFEIYVLIVYILLKENKIPDTLLKNEEGVQQVPSTKKNLQKKRICKYLKRLFIVLLSSSRPQEIFSPSTIVNWHFYGEKN